MSTLRHLTKSLLALLFCAALPCSGWAQTLRGIVTEATTGEPIIGATVVLKEISKGTITGTDGDYTISDIPTGRYTIEASYVGFNPMTMH